MRLKRLCLLSVGAAALLLPGVLTPGAAQENAGQGLTVNVQPQQPSVSEGTLFNVPVNLNLSVVNSSDITQSFQVMSCSWEGQWEFSDRRLSFGSYACAANAPQTITLAPGASYSKRWGVYLCPIVWNGKQYVMAKFPPRLSFRLGFTPLGNGKTYWSQSVSLHVVTLK